MKKLTFEIRSPAHQQNAIHAVQQILPDPTKPIVVTIQERNRSLDQNRKLWACLGDVSRQVEWHGRWLDSAASDKNALCAHWLTEADDALNSEWISHGAIWNNPPYSNIRPWVEKAAEQCIQQRQTVVMLVPEDMSVGWFSKALESVDEVRIITDGRINFIEPSTGLEKKGNSKGSMLLIWRPFISPRRMFTTVSKAALMAIGQGVRRAE